MRLIANNHLTALIYIYIYIYIYILYIHIQSWSELLAPLVNMIKEGSEKTCILILLIFYLKRNHKNLTFHWTKTNWKWGKISLWNKCFFSNTRWTQLLVPLETVLWVKYIWSIFPFILTILSTPGGLWTWNYPAMASFFTEI